MKSTVRAIYQKYNAMVIVTVILVATMQLSLRQMQPTCLHSPLQKNSLSWHGEIISTVRNALADRRGVALSDTEYCILARVPIGASRETPVRDTVTNDDKSPSSASKAAAPRSQGAAALGTAPDEQELKMYPAWYGRRITVVNVSAPRVIGLTLICTSEAS